MSHQDETDQNSVRARLEAGVPEPPSMHGYAVAARKQARRRRNWRAVYLGGAVVAVAATAGFGAPAILDAISPSPSPVAAPALETEDPTTEPTRPPALPAPDCVDRGGPDVFHQLTGPGAGEETAKEAVYDQATAYANPPFELVETASGLGTSHWSLLRADGSVRATIEVLKEGSNWTVSSVVACPN